jgi:cell wall-associated NlpC family hydrolase
MRKLLPVLLLCSACTSTPHREPAGRNDAMNEVAIYAMSLADTPYQFGGNSLTSGFDCSGFVRHVFQQSLGRTLPRTSQEMSNTGEPLEAGQLRPGDLVFFNTQQQPFSHVGIYVGEERFVHSPSSGKAISIVNMREDYWRRRYNGARRIQSSL